MHTASNAAVAAVSTITVVTVGPATWHRAVIEHAAGALEHAMARAADDPDREHLLHWVGSADIHSATWGHACAAFAAHVDGLWSALSRRGRWLAELPRASVVLERRTLLAHTRSLRVHLSQHDPSEIPDVEFMLGSRIRPGSHADGSPWAAQVRALLAEQTLAHRAAVRTLIAAENGPIDACIANEPLAACFDIEWCTP